MLRKNFDSRRDIIVPGNKEKTLEFCVEQLIELANEAIQKKGVFTLALSGGSTPKAIYQSLASEANRNRVDWSKVYLFWSDERSVPPSDSESNFHMAMNAGFATLPLKADHIFRMKAEDHIEQHTDEYEISIKEHVADESFDVIMLGMGDDGHTASLFPYTKGLDVTERLVVANSVPQKNTMRMSFTYPCINKAHHILIYVLGTGKEDTVEKVLKGSYDPEAYPIQKIGTASHKAIWILDQDAASKL
jgi:6-phosphogluconolactonase